MGLWRAFVGLLVFTAVLTAGAIGIEVAFSEPTSEFDETQAEQVVHAEVNERRTKHGLPPLDYSSNLAEVAEYHNENMISESFYAHDSPNGSSPSTRYARFGIPCYAAENIYKLYYRTTMDTEGDQYLENETEVGEAAVNGWMRSQGHRENILNGEIVAEGVDVEMTTEDDKKVVYVTQNFCVPK